jgi:hypothetical protein
MAGMEPQVYSGLSIRVHQRIGTAKAPPISFPGILG